MSDGAKGTTICFFLISILCACMAVYAGNFTEIGLGVALGCVAVAICCSCAAIGNVVNADESPCTKCEGWKQACKRTEKTLAALKQSVAEFK